VRLAYIPELFAMIMHIREQKVAAMPAKLVGKLCTRGRALAHNNVPQNVQADGLARANWQVSVQAEFKVVQKLASHKLKLDTHGEDDVMAELMSRQLAMSLQLCCW
jgi:hypothetical protein